MKPWEELENGNYEAALNLFKEQAESETDLVAKAWAIANCVYPLVKLKRFQEAQECVKEVWDQTKDSHFLHQMAFVEREAGNYEKALELIEQERLTIEKDDYLRSATNSYEQAKLRQHLNQTIEAKIWVEQCQLESSFSNDRILKACALRLEGDQFFLEKDLLNAQVAYAHAQWNFILAQDFAGSREILEQQIQAQLSHSLENLYFRIPNIEDKKIQSLLIKNRADSYFTSFGTDADFWKENLDGSNYIKWLEEKLMKFTAPLICLYQNEQMIGQLEFGLLKDDPSIGYVNLYYVIPDFRHQKLGSLLNQYTELHFKKLGIKKIQLSVSPTNKTALRFYEKHSWKDLGPRKTDPRVHVMEKIVF